MANTSIEWTDKVWNPVTGCTKVSAGCKNCYAERMMGRNLPGMTQKFTDVVCHPERLEAPLHWRKPSRIFVNSMSDLFHKDVPDEFIVSVFAIAAICHRHIFQILTKRPERMPRLIPKTLGDAADWLEGAVEKMLGEYAALANWPLPNVWLGVSVENQETADERIPLLLQTPAAVRFVSYEPALGPVDFSPWLHKRFPSTMHKGQLERIDQIICGGESGPGARPMHPEWARSVRDQCKAAGVPFFFKQWGEWLGPMQDGAQLLGGGQQLNCTTLPVRIGKKAAGCLLDGVEHKEFPEVARG